MAGSVHHAIDNAAAAGQACDRPAGWLVPGPDRAGNLLEPVVPDRPAGWRSSTRSRRGPGTGGCSRIAGQNRHQPPASRERHASHRRGRRGHGRQAGRGYALDEVLYRRKCRRPALGSGAASVESVRLDPELTRALLVRAAAERVSVSAVTAPKFPTLFTLSRSATAGWSWAMQRGDGNELNSSQVVEFAGTSTEGSV